MGDGTAYFPRDHEGIIPAATGQAQAKAVQRLAITTGMAAAIHHGTLRMNLVGVARKRWPRPAAPACSCALQPTDRQGLSSPAEPPDTGVMFDAWVLRLVSSVQVLEIPLLTRAKRQEAASFRKAWRKVSRYFRSSFATKSAIIGHKKITSTAATQRLFWSRKSELAHCSVQLEWSFSALCCTRFQA